MTTSTYFLFCMLIPEVCYSHADELQTYMLESLSSETSLHNPQFCLNFMLLNLQNTV